LLVRGDSLLVLDLGLNIVDRIGGLDLKGDGLARKGLDEAVDFVSLVVVECGETEALGVLTSALLKDESQQRLYGYFESIREQMETHWLRFLRR
jgi:hypothetical protein